MASKWVDERDSRFILFEVLKLNEGILGKGMFEDHDEDMVNMILTEAAKLAENEIAPTYPDEQHGKPIGAEFKDGQVITPESYKRLWQLYTEGGWMATSDSYEVGGQQLPASVSAICANMFLSCNQAFMMYPGLSHGAARLMEDFYHGPHRDIILENMFSGVWAGTMCLTEPSAGTDVGMLKSTARKNADGSYTITGTKSFISSGDHDLTENIIHPVLARIDGDPAGTPGISIFMVPKYKINDDGSCGELNDVNTGGIEHKMGIHGNATCTLNFGENGNCVGYLMGEEREGMKIMFHMMNEERQGVGMMGVSLATAAYRHAVQYTKERLQGSNIAQMKDPDAPRVPIIQHPDVRRMLIKMKSYVEGMRMLTLLCYHAMDMTRIVESDDEKAKWSGMVEILTPIVKSYCTDGGMIVNDLAVQSYGGYGYCREYPVEQMMRDQKINCIYEGTNGVQAMDLLGRKLGLQKGMVFMNLLGWTQETTSKAQGTAFEKEAGIVADSLNAIAETAMAFKGLIKTNPFVPLIGAMDFLNCFGDALVGWCHLWMALEAQAGLDKVYADNGATEDPGKQFELLLGNKDAQFYSGKIESAKFFIGRQTGLVRAKLANLQEDETSAMRITEDGFAV